MLAKTNVPRRLCNCNQGKLPCQCKSLETDMNNRDGETPAADETTIEKRIVEAGLIAPRITPTQIDAAIVREDYHVFPGTTVTVALLELHNGFCVTGESAAASPENFNEQIGCDIARRNARDKIWSLEGYALRNILAAQKLPHEDRVRAEYDELNGKLSRLDAFIVESPIFSTLAEDEQRRMKAQAEAMRIYSRVLAARIDAFAPAS